MNIQDFLDSVGGIEIIQIAAIIITFIVLFVMLALWQRRMSKMGNNWAEVAQANGLQYASNPVSYDYGMIVGSRTFDYPGMAGMYRGRAVQVGTTMGAESGDAGKWMFEAAISLKSPKPFSALAHKRGFENLAKERIKKDSKTGVKSIDSAFKIRSEDPSYIARVFENSTVLEALKQQKFRNAHFMFDGSRLYFLGAINGQANPEQALNVLNILVELAEAAD